MALFISICVTYFYATTFLGEDFTSAEFPVDWLIALTIAAASLGISFVFFLIFSVLFTKEEVVLAEYDMAKVFDFEGNDTESYVLDLLLNNKDYYLVLPNFNEAKGTILLPKKKTFLIESESQSEFKLIVKKKKFKSKFLEWVFYPFSSNSLNHMYELHIP